MFVYCEVLVNPCKISLEHDFICVIYKKVTWAMNREEMFEIFNHEKYLISIFEINHLKKKINNNNYLICENNFSRPTLEHMVSKVSTIPNTSTSSYILTDKAGEVST